MTSLATTPLRRARLSRWTASAALLTFTLAAARSDTLPVLSAPHEPTLGELLAADEDEVVLPLEGIMPSPSQSATQLPAPQSNPDAVQPGVVHVSGFKTFHRSGNGDIQASGGGQMVYTEEGATSTTTLTAQEINYVAATGQLNAVGTVHLSREASPHSEAVQFVGQSLTYNFQTQTGRVSNAFLAGDYFTASGKVITAQPDGTYVVEQGEYTTCIRNRPDYKIRARRLTVKPGQYVSARGVILYVGGTRLISWSSYRVSLKRAHSAPVPLPGYNKTDSLFVRLHDTPIEEDHHSLDYDARIGVRRLPVGLVGYVADIAPPAYHSPPPRIYLNTLIDPLRGILEQISPPTYTEYTENSFRDQFSARSTVDAVFQNNMGVYNRQRTDLSLTRAEVALRLINLLGNREHTAPASPTDTQNPPERVLGNTESVLQRVPNAPFLLDANFVLSEIHEMPTNVTAGRFSFHAALATQPLIIGKRISLRAGLSNWFRLYTTGTAHDLTSPEVALDYVPTRTSRIGVAYRYVSTAGTTPFAFDARDIRNEVRLQYQVSGPWAFGVVSKIDVDRSRSYDTEFAVLRNFDCMQVGINYRVRNQSFNIIFNLLPPTQDRARRQMLPLNPGPSLSLNHPNQAQSVTSSSGLNPNAVTTTAFGNTD